MQTENAKRFAELMAEGKDEEGAARAMMAEGVSIDAAVAAARAYAKGRKVNRRSSAYQNYHHDGYGEVCGW